MIPSSLYPRLPNGRFIRLLKLLPSNPGDRAEDATSSGLSCQLTAFDLDSPECPPFAALSYTWGSPFVTHDGEEEKRFEGAEGQIEIQLRFDDGVDHQEGRSGQSSFHLIYIGRNLADGLHQIRRGGTWGSWLWADVLCINQADIAEKSAQVSMMGSIYSTAEITIVWLGVADQSSKTFIDVHDDYGQTLASLFSRISHLTRLRPTKSEGIAQCDATGRMISCDTIDPIVSFFYGRRYFGRVWVVQEYGLAKEQKILYDTAVLEEFVLLIMANLLCHNFGTIVSLLSPYSDLIPSFRRATMLRNGLIKNRSELPGLLKEMHRASNLRTILYEHLAKLLLNTDGFEASVEHDHVYSVLGLVQAHLRPGEKPLFQVDYDRPYHEVCRNIATVLLKESPSLSVLAFAAQTGNKRHTSLPSWCPVWGEGINSRGRIPVPGMTSTASAYPSKSESDMQTVIVGDRLELMAARCAYVTSLSVSMKYGTKEYPLSEMRKCAYVLSLIEDLGPIYHGNQDIITAIIHSTALYVDEGPSTRQCEPKQDNEASRDFAILPREEWINRFSKYIQISLYFIVMWRDSLSAATKKIDEEEADGEETNREHPSGERKDDKTFDEEKGYEKTHHDEKQTDYEEADDKLLRLATFATKCDQTLRRLGGRYGLPTQLNPLSPEQAASVEDVGFPEHSRDLFEGVRYNRIMLRTSNDYICVAWSSVREGDELWLPCKGHMPLILRRVPGRDQYICISEAYVQGGMRGEMIERGHVGQLQKIALV